ncbi:hypothetical protein AAFF_G00331530 [Aldrovandia affinis]|uniref:BED-type domain-containing protein n=1 Tax=Aldrovandia affinis TaxID=143900 RepID=A0AAD7SNF7_9TELE|nr:hypothetical protein AAFF_G00331530 [Aldrovandia affinis]
MSNCVVFQTKLASIVDILVQAAVAVIDNLVDEDSTLTLRLKVAQDELDREVLKKKIQTQNKLITTRFASIMGILGKEALEKIIKLVDEMKPQLMECDIETVEDTMPEDPVNVLVVDKSEEQSSLDVNMEVKEEPFIVVNEEDCPLDPVVLKGKDMTEGRGCRSWVWGHFTLLNPNKVQCGLCNNLLSYYKNTSGMLRHIRTRHPAVHQCDTPSVIMAATQTESDGFIGPASLDVDLEMPEGRCGRSWVWDYFTMLNPNKVQCGLCQNMLSYNKNTSGMLRHMRTRHPTAIIVAAATRTDAANFMGQAELEVELDAIESRGGRSWVWDHFTLFAPNKVQCQDTPACISVHLPSLLVLLLILNQSTGLQDRALMRETRLEDDSGSTDPPRELKVSADRAVESGSDPFRRYTSRDSKRLDIFSYTALKGYTT